MYRWNRDFCDKDENIVNEKLKHQWKQTTRLEKDFCFLLEVLRAFDYYRYSCVIKIKHPLVLLMFVTTSKGTWHKVLVMTCDMFPVHCIFLSWLSSEQESHRQKIFSSSWWLHYITEVYFMLRESQDEEGIFHKMLLISDLVREMTKVPSYTQTYVSH